MRWVLLPIAVPMLSGLPARLIGLLVLFNDDDFGSLVDGTRISPWLILGTFLNAFLEPVFTFWIAPNRKERAALIAAIVLTVIAMAVSAWFKSASLPSIAAILCGQLAGLMAVYVFSRRQKPRPAAL